jgi:integrase/recombinase XerD
MERLFEQFKVYLLTERRVSKNTLEAYSADLRQLLDFVAENALFPEQIQQSDLKEFLAILKKQNLSARSMARKISSIKAFFSYMHRYHGIENCSEVLMFPKIGQRLPKCLSENDIEALLAVAADDHSKIGLRNRVMLSLLYVTGMRISEITTLCVTDIRYDISALAVRGKGGKGRLIPVPAPILALVEDYRKSSVEMLRNTHHVLGDIPYVFPVYYKGGIKPMTRQACWSIIKKVWARTGIQKKISPHMLRHSLATHMLKHGADLRSLQMLLGHENLSTVQIYTHLDTSYLRSIYDAKHPRS